MTLVASIDYVAKRIYLHADTVGVDLDMLDVYKEVRALRVDNESHRGFKPIIVASGNIEKVAGQTFTAIAIQLLFGCRIVPYDASQKLRLVRDTFTDDGLAGRDVFDRTSLSASTRVDIDVDFPEIEIRVISTGGSALTTEEHDALIAVPTAQENADTLLDTNT